MGRVYDFLWEIKNVCCVAPGGLGGCEDQVPFVFTGILSYRTNKQPACVVMTSSYLTVT